MMHAQYILNLNPHCYNVWTTVISLCMDVSHSVCLYVDQIFSSTEPIFFRDKTSFRQFLTWLLPGLKEMLILIISNTEGVKVLVCPAIFWTL